MQSKGSGVCEGPLKDPLVLPCGHTFCKQYLEGLDPPECPLCSQRFESVLLCAPHLATLKNEKEDTLCNNCTEKKAQLWCQDCGSGTNYCQRCDQQVHSANALKQHYRIAIMDKPNTPTFLKCSKHKKDKEVYCVECVDFVCVECIIEEHCKHRLHNVLWYEKQAKRDLGKGVEFVLKGLHCKQERSEGNIKMYEEKALRVKEKIEEYTERLLLIKQQTDKIKIFQTSLEKSIQGLGIDDLMDETNEKLIAQKIAEALKNVVTGNEIETNIFQSEQEYEIEKLEKKKSKLQKLHTKITKIEKARKERMDKEKEIKRKILMQHIKKELATHTKNDKARVEHESIH
eukprot:TRINITY_DN3940_c0_g1_i1.p1 TRINITY_DN3940_c0_g1~~TRINITY_DN3940_c0_g1_i1.p1  ORF type:complete len:344 (-),score=90.18 TRINITY_DN3940_c0_g1_i1:21-1052(-)